MILHNLVPRDAGKEVAKTEKTANAKRIVSSKTFSLLRIWTDYYPYAVICSDVMTSTLIKTLRKFILNDNSYYWKTHFHRRVSIILYHCSDDMSLLGFMIDILRCVQSPLRVNLEAPIVIIGQWICCWLANVFVTWCKPSHKERKLSSDLIVNSSFMHC